MSLKDYFVVFGPEGPSTLWGLGGHLKLADVGGIISEVATANVEDVNIGSVLASVLPSSILSTMLSSLDLNLRKPSDPITPLAVRFLTIAGLHYKSLREKML